MATMYLPCPNGCTGEVPMEIDGGGQFDDPYNAGVAEADNATSHDDGCPPLTDEQRDALADQAVLNAADPAYGFWDREPIIYDEWGPDSAQEALERGPR